MKEIRKVLVMFLAGLLVVSFLGCGNPTSGGGSSFSSEPIFEEIAKECTEPVDKISSVDLSGKWEFVQEAISTQGGDSGKQIFKTTMEFESGNKSYYAVGTISVLTVAYAIIVPTEAREQIDQTYADKNGITLTWSADGKSYKATETFNEKTECQKAVIQSMSCFNESSTTTKNSEGTQYLDVLTLSAPNGGGVTIKTFLKKIEED